ncbi:MAG TPA: NAD(P)-dependent oxidoreductase [Candidatus Didemnitutus sp.]|nr:NAD(P)-dependent oxidoreductase [Candidatus Didemnitutus sp.]
MTERRKIFLLGGTGFIGAALARQLSGDRSNNDLMMLIHHNARWRELEQVNTQTGDLGTFDLSLLDRFSPGSILHLARISGRGRIGRFLAARRGGSANRRLIRHLRRLPVKPHTIYVSGTLVYGDCGPTPADEDRPIRPIAFAREYIGAEKPWMEAQREGDLPVTILRPPWIIGPGSWFGGYYLKNIAQHRMIPLFGDGKNLMSLLDVEDCAGLIAHAVGNAEAGRNYNLFAPGACITQLELAEKLSALTGAEIRRFTRAEVDRRFGKTIWEACTFSNVTATKHPSLLEGYTFRHPSIDEMLGKNVPAELRR